MFAVLRGNEAHLKLLSEHFEDKSCRVLYDGKEYVLSSDEFLTGESIDIIRGKTKQLILRLKAIALLSFGTNCDIESGGAHYQFDGPNKIIYVEVKSELKISGTASVGKIAKNGTEEDSPLSVQIQKWIKLSSHDLNIQKLFECLSWKLDWVNLYRIIEMIEDDLSKSKNAKGIVACGWVSEPTMRKFKYTANSIQGAGLDARHGKETTSPPKHPMLIEDARVTVQSIVCNWLNSK